MEHYIQAIVIILSLTLIKYGAPLDHVNNLGWTALIEAIILGNGGPNQVETVRALVSAGANQNIADREGIPPPRARFSIGI